jgi:chorismate dehydratase
LRIGCVKYLNARPLIRGWPGEVEFDHPSALCRRLANGELDVALVSSFEFLRNPIYRIVDGISISSDGPVYSVVLAYRGSVSKMEEIELDPASETSANLMRCLLAERALTPQLTRNVQVKSVPAAGLQPAGSAPVEPTNAEAPGNSTAARTDKMSVSQPPDRAWLLIGDQAIRFRQKYSRKCRFWDLGDEWKKLTGLPFVYALWLIRPEVEDAKSIAQRLRELRNQNLARIEEVISEIAAAVPHVDDQKIDREFLNRYYRKHLRFDFGEKEKHGLQAFAHLCVTHGLLPTGDPLLNVI